VPRRMKVIIIEVATVLGWLLYYIPISSL
jgi:hypothetical protein